MTEEPAHRDFARVISRKWAPAIIALSIVLLLLVWSATHIVRNERYTLLTAPSQAGGPDISGVYRVQFDGASRKWGVATSPFSNRGDQPSVLMIKANNDTVEILERNDGEWDIRQQFVVGDDFYWSGDAEASFRQFHDQSGVRILPGSSTDRNEGWIRVQPDGDLKVERVYWEKGLVLYLFPFYDETRFFFTFEKTQPDRALEGAIDSPSR